MHYNFTLKMVQNLNIESIRNFEEHYLSARDDTNELVNNSLIIFSLLIMKAVHCFSFSMWFVLEVECIVFIIYLPLARTNMHKFDLFIERNFYICIDQNENKQKHIKEWYSKLILSISCWNRKKRALQKIVPIKFMDKQSQEFVHHIGSISFYWWYT